MLCSIQDFSGRSGDAPISIQDADQLLVVLARLADLEPRALEIGPVGSGHLLVWIGGPWAAVEYCQLEPWRSVTAIVERGTPSEMRPESLRFDAGGEATEIPGANLIPVGLAISLITETLRSGELPATVRWVPT